MHLNLQQNIQIHSKEILQFEHVYTIKIPTLTKCECRFCAVLRMYSTLKETAEFLNIAQSTAETHCRNIKRKLGITGKEHLYKYLVAINTE